MQTAAKSTEGKIRTITDEEIAFYHLNGWVRLEQLISASLALEVLRRFQRLMGVDTENESSTSQSMVEVDRFRYYGEGIAQDDLIREVALSRRLGLAARTLMGVEQLKLFGSSVLCKPPAGDDGGNPTKWHQDYPQTSLDRALLINFWMALDEMTPEMGVLQYLSGSHRERPLGRLLTTDDEPPKRVFEQYSVSPLFEMKPGDVLAHDCLTLHSSGPNRGGRDRWAWSTTRFSAEARYNGASAVRTDHHPQVVDAHLGDAAFPLIAT